MTWLVALIFIIPILILIWEVRILLAIISFALHVLSLYVLFVVAALLTAFLCVGSGHYGEFAKAVTAGLTGGP